MFDKDRLYLHPVNSSQRLKTKHFQIKNEGTYKGTRMRLIESQHPAVHGNYRHGIMIEMPNKSPMVVYGEYESIQNTANAIKKDPDALQKRIRPVGRSESNQYYLNKPAPPRLHQEMTGSEMEKAAAAHAIYPNQGKENRPLSRMQEEKQAAKEHLRELAESKVMYKDTVDGKAEIDKQLNPTGGGVSTLVTATDVPDSE